MYEQDNIVAPQIPVSGGLYFWNFFSSIACLPAAWGRFLVGPLVGLVEPARGHFLFLEGGVDHAN